MEKIGYLGPEGSYSHLACGVLCPEATPAAYPSFRHVMNALSSGDCDFIVLPVENSLNGGVNQNLDLLQATQNVIAFGECALKIDHRLATLKGAKKCGISRIYSHQQALEQCGEYLFKNFPAAKQIAVTSTAAALGMIKSSRDAAIVGAHVKREDISLSPENIADEKFNVTKFLLIKRGTKEDCGRSERIFFSAACKHAPGELYCLLSVIYDGGLNMTKIQSRPVKDSPGEYRFFIEVEGDYSNGRVKEVIERVKNASKSFKILGLY